ncbi:E3 ubiquitin-protein ligase xiap [Plakobranchus ocellatus]|uniref:E3 ubiquitin-protein ligase xiap n=1 Tax=Plakobranchus ocellatus TaxID=259542 RepID=A0AAV3YQS8_9GAST|nr:E3 ubiquitin-protein ligase xiap [Plakobranchus ocellatus]
MATGTSPEYWIYEEWYEERRRRDSFSNYPSNAAKCAVLLAAAGFIYIGNGCSDIVCCCFCKGVKSDWTQDEDIGAVHRRMSPDCPMVTGSACGNIPSDHYPETGDRVEDFDLRSNTNGLPESTRARIRHAFLSRGEFANTGRAEPPTHSGRNMENIHSQGTSSSDIRPWPHLSRSAVPANPPRAPQSQTHRDLGIDMHWPWKTEYADLNRRLETFAIRSANHPLPARNLADARYFYADHESGQHTFTARGSQIFNSFSPFRTSSKQRTNACYGKIPSSFPLLCEDAFPPKSTKATQISASSHRARPPSPQLATSASNAQGLHSQGPYCMGDRALAADLKS